ncbi:MAG: hypothetical protein HY268_21025 [Deltaproteobacteria bacterium]|nr:hypothetical protein [Deltaproteobacteria bacterium]
MKRLTRTEAVAAKIRGADWGETAYSFDFRPAAQAWDAAVKTLHETLDQRFGPGRGLAVAMVENFDVVAKTLFGADALMRSKTKSAATEAAIERRAAEERLRKFMGRKDARFMLIASATGTVDLDYERPLFLAFKPIDLTTWDGDTCIAYFNKRRQLNGAPELTAVETARARAIAEFIGGNPRSAQLLAEVLHSPDARTIAQTLDALSDHLADYYRRRLDDLAANTAGLLDALIRTGEPCSQSELAERVGTQQSQIADAFRYLLQARLLSAVRESNGHGTLYRVRDRLFVHFYRRRYDGKDQSAGLAPIVELLATFFSAKERNELARRHVEAGEFAEARIFRRLGGTRESNPRGYNGFRDETVTGAPSKLWEFTGLKLQEIEPARLELRNEPDKACKRWGDAAKSAQSPLQRTVVKILQAVAASRLDDDVWAQELLDEAFAIGETDVTTDARILAVDEMATFSWHCLHDRARSLAQVASLQEWAYTAVHDYAKICAYVGSSLSAGEEGRHQEAIQAAETAASLANAIADTRSQTTALTYKAWSLGELDHHQDAIAVWDEAATLAAQVGDVNAQAVCLSNKAWSLGKLGHHQDAIAVWDEAATLAAQVGDVNAQAVCLSNKAWNLSQLDRIEEALATFDQATALAKEAQVLNELSLALRWKSALLMDNGQLPAALKTIQAALAVYDQGVNQQERRWGLGLFFQIVAKMVTPDVITRLVQVLAETTTDDRWFDIYLGDVMAAVTRAEVWAELRDLVQKHEVWFAKAQPSLIFNKVGTVWTDFVTTRGRAATFALVARDLPVIAEVMTKMPSGAHLPDLVAGIVSTCADAGFLRDVAGLIVEVFGPEEKDEATRLRAFAEVHAAEDKEKVLQRFDPDLAKAIRRMWNLPEPEDLLARRGRPKGR